jgi:hypothetical protein
MGHLSQMLSSSGGSLIGRSMYGLSFRELAFPSDDPDNPMPSVLQGHAAQFRPDGMLTVHLPELRSVTVEYNRRETIEAFRARLQERVPNLCVRDFLIVSKQGTITDETTLDDYALTSGADLILVRKGVATRQEMMNRLFWLRSREYALRGEPRPVVLARTVQPHSHSHRITPMRLFVRK